MSAGIALNSACLLCGCASGPEKRTKVNYRKSAKANFLKGKKALEDEDYLEAIEFFKFVKNRFPYSTYATQADLLLADCHFGRDRFVEAADAYQNFIKLHPRHEKVPYAMYRVGLSLFQRIPDDWWFAPPAYELDESETKRAVTELQRYVKRYPKDEYSGEANKLLKQGLQRLAYRVQYIMEFYYGRKHMRAVLWRADELLSKYSGLGFDELAMYRKAQAQVDLGELKEARATLGKLLEKFPSGNYSSDAKSLLERIESGRTAKKGSASN
jgi:outer membrane protein assembly factor BamD